MKVPMSETGTASIGMSEARQPCKKNIHDNCDQQERLPQGRQSFLDPRLTASVVSSDTA